MKLRGVVFQRKCNDKRNASIVLRAGNERRLRPHERERLSRGNSRDRDPPRSGNATRAGARSTLSRRAGSPPFPPFGPLKFHTSPNVVAFNRPFNPLREYNRAGTRWNICCSTCAHNAFYALVPIPSRLLFFFLRHDKRKNRSWRVRAASRLAHYKERLANGSQLRTTFRERGRSNNNLSRRL